MPFKLPVVELSRLTEHGFLSLRNGQDVPGIERLIGTFH